MAKEKSGRKTLFQAINELAKYQGVEDKNNIYRTMIYDKEIDTASEEAAELAIKLAKQFLDDPKFDELMDTLVQGTEGGSPVGSYSVIKDDGTKQVIPGFFANLSENLSGIGADADKPAFLKDAFNFVGNWNGRLDGVKMDEMKDYFYGGDTKNVSITSTIYGADLPTGLELSSIECEGDITKSAPIINVTAMKAPWLSRGATDANLAKLFAQGIPSTVFSQAVPYFDVKVLDSTIPQISGDGGTGVRAGEGLSNTKFILGFQSLDKTQQEFADVSIASEAPPPTPTDDDHDLMQYQRPSIAGMELFTMPQTFVGKVGPYQDLNIDVDIDSSRKNAILDPFRPLMTVKGFRCNVDVSNVTCATIRGSMDIVLHDRSRMHEIASLLRPDLSARQEVLVEWGWSHPRTDTAFGKIINSARQVRKFIVMGSNYTFDASGHVNIQLQLIAKGFNSGIRELPTAVPGGAVDIISDLKVIGKSIAVNMEDPLMKGIFEDLPVGKFMNVSNTLTISSKQLDEITTQVKKFRKGQKNENALAVLKSIDEAVAQVKNYRDEVKDAFTLIEKYIKKDIVPLDTPVTKETAHDPWAEEWQEVSKKQLLGEDKNEGVGFDSKRHISLGRLLSILMIPKLFGKKTFDAIDFIYYPCNKDAYGLSLFSTIASLPIRKDKIIKLFTLFRDTVPNPPMIAVIELIVNFLNKYKGNDSGWGIGGALTSYINEETGEVYTKLKDGSKKAFVNAITKAGMAYYKEPRKMQAPKITTEINAVPFKDDPSKTMLRVVVFDATYNGYTTYVDAIRQISNKGLKVMRDQDGAASNGTQGQLETVKQFRRLESVGILKKIKPPAGLTDYMTGDNKQLQEAMSSYEIRLSSPAKLKAFLHQVMPSFKYGTEHTIIKAATVSANSDPKAGLIQLSRNMKAAGRPAGTEAGESVPYEVMPSSLTLVTQGCPFINHGQQFFFDYQTNTSIDNVYVVTKIEHNVSPGVYETTIRFQNVGFYGIFEGIANKFSELQDAIKADIARAEGEQVDELLSTDY